MPFFLCGGINYPEVGGIRDVTTGEVYQLVTGWTGRGTILVEGRLKGTSPESKEYDAREIVGYSSQGRLDQPEARPLVAHSIVGNALPDKGLNPLSMIVA